MEIVNLEKMNNTTFKEFGIKFNFSEEQGIYSILSIIRTELKKQGINCDYEVLK